jgi:hypothetical protein
MTIEPQLLTYETFHLHFLIQEMFHPKQRFIRWPIFRFVVWLLHSVKKN